MYKNCQSERYNKNYNNNRYYEILQNQKLSNNYYNDSHRLNNNKLQNMTKLEKNKSSSMDKLNIDKNIYSYKNDQTNYNNNNYNNNYNEEDLDIELESVSTKIPINDFNIDNEKKNIYENSETKYKYRMVNNDNNHDYKTCSSLIRKKYLKFKGI